MRAKGADLAEGPEGTGLSQGEPGVHQSAQGRLLPWDAVVVIVFRFLLIPPGRVLWPGQPGDRQQAGAQAGASGLRGRENDDPQEGAKALQLEFLALALRAGCGGSYVLFPTGVL